MTQIMMLLTNVVMTVLCGWTAIQMQGQGRHSEAFIGWMFAALNLILVIGWVIIILSRREL